MIKFSKFLNASISVSVILSTFLLSTPAKSQIYSVDPELEAKILSHPNIRRLTDWGSRPEWSADSKKLLFVSRELGDAFEIDVESGKTRPLTFHFRHAGIFRAYYLPNGDLLLTAPKQSNPTDSEFSRFFTSEMWVLKADLTTPPTLLGETNFEGVAVARNSSRIVWARPGPMPGAEPGAPVDKERFDLTQFKAELWTGDIVYTNGNPQLTNRRKLLDCEPNSGSPLAAIHARLKTRCVGMEPQNLVPRDENQLTFTMLALAKSEGQRSQMSTYVLDLRSGQVRNISPYIGFGYEEAEGIFPSGRYTVTEYANVDTTQDMRVATKILDLWRLPLDGSGKRVRMTRLNDIDPRLKSNQGVISPDGRWMAFGVSTSEIESKVSGQGLGIFLMDLRAAALSE